MTTANGKANRKAVRALVFKSEKSAAAEAPASLANPWDTEKGENGLLVPHLDPIGLAAMIDHSTMLGQCVEVMEINISGFGYRLKIHKDVESESSMKTAIEEEGEVLKSFLRYANYEEESFTRLRRNTRRDVETTGFSWWEVLRNESTNKIVGFKQCPAYSVRMAPRQTIATLFKQNRIVGSGTKRKIVTVDKHKHFRKYAQIRQGFLDDGQAKITWFKEYGDPRRMNRESGEYDEKTPPEKLATEMIHHFRYSGSEPYGSPRYIGAMLALVGARSSEEINFHTFRNNNIPSMALLVSGGSVTDETIDRLAEFASETIQGSDNYSKFLVIEATPDEEEGDSSSVRLELKPLTAEQHTDAMFQNYDANAREKIRESFRIPPILIGRSEDYTRATADASLKMTDEQVFDPERRDEDHLINRILVDMGMLYHEFQSNTPNVTNDQDIINIIAAAEKAGGMTPRVAHGMIEDLLGKEMSLPQGIDLDVPFSKQMAEAVKNMASPNEVGQQVTALKRFEDTLNDPKKSWSEMLIEKSEDEKRVAINCGSQAEDILSGNQLAALFDIRLNLEGRILLVSDGEIAAGEVTFGMVEKKSIKSAARISGISEEEITSLFPGVVEIWVAPIEGRKLFEAPVLVSQYESVGPFTVIGG
jgi:PBSX family phage portal protein